MGARDSLLRLHHLNGVGDTRTKTIARLRQRRFGQINVAARHVHKIFGRLQIQQSGAHVGINLRPEIVQAFLALLESCVGLKDVAVNAASLKNGNRQRYTRVEHLRSRRDDALLPRHSPR